MTCCVVRCTKTEKSFIPGMVALPKKYLCVGTFFYQRRLYNFQVPVSAPRHDSFLVGKRSVSLGRRPLSSFLLLSFPILSVTPSSPWEAKRKREGAANPIEREETQDQKGFRLGVSVAKLGSKLSIKTFF